MNKKTRAITPLPLFDLPAQEAPRDPSLVVVSTSGGKDSWHALEQALLRFGGERVVAHHQVVLDDWPGTVEYVQATCAQLGVPLYLAQGRYTGLLCRQCGHRHLTVNVEEAYCHQCGSREHEALAQVESVGDMVRWRRMWPGPGPARWCTSHFKRDVFNGWARQHQGLLGAHPLFVMGERRRESRERANLREVEPRERLVRPGWMLVWHPILEAERIDSFRALRRLGIAPHYCYAVQWGNMLRLQHRRWRSSGTRPHESYPGQWDGLEEQEELAEAVVAPMVERLMYEVREEGGGPRCSCVRCIYKDAEQIEASYLSPQGRASIEEGFQIEEETGHSFHNGESLRQMATTSSRWEPPRVVRPDRPSGA